ncbi:c-type cytochrome [Alkalihalobacterium sp. APHAB7]|uniref:c-type cytochrome n=1 Tax=Alkalihalobacterium sp. APHAB7 TaxID=3402081 RepID=UPI003AAFA56E
MKSSILTFVLTFAIAFGGGYLVFQPEKEAEIQHEQSEETGQDQMDAVEIAEEMSATVDSLAGETLNNFSCLTCHAVSGLGLDGGVTGPDLTNSYLNVEGKHGKPLDEYLKEPTSAVMSSVVSGNPMSDEEIEAIVAILKEASEQ